MKIPIYNHQVPLVEAIMDDLEAAVDLLETMLGGEGESAPSAPAAPSQLMPPPPPPPPPPPKTKTVKMVRMEEGVNRSATGQSTHE